MKIVIDVRPLDNGGYRAHCFINGVDETVETHDSPSAAEALGHLMLDLSTTHDLENGVKLDITINE